MITTTLKKYIKESGLKHKYIALKIGISNVWFSKFYNGSAELSSTDMKSLLYLLNKFK